MFVQLRKEGVKIRIRKEEGGLEVLAKVVNKASFLESGSKKKKFCQKTVWI